MTFLKLVLDDKSSLFISVELNLIKIPAIFNIKGRKQMGTPLINC